MTNVIGEILNVMSPLVRLIRLWVPNPLARSTMMPVMPRVKPLTLAKVAVPVPLKPTLSGAIAASSLALIAELLPSYFELL